MLEAFLATFEPWQAGYARDGIRDLLVRLAVTRYERRAGYPCRVATVSELADMLDATELRIFEILNELEAE